MATQLKPSDFTYAAQAPRPNIRVVFNAGPAALAVREKADQLPADIRDATLDEITSDPHAAWDAACLAYDDAVQVRDAFLASTMDPANGLLHQVKTAGLPIDYAKAHVATCEAEFGKHLMVVSNAVEQMLLVPAPDAGALNYKVKVFFAEECHEHCGYEKALEVMRDDAERFLTTPVDPFMRGPMLAWHKGCEAFTTARQARATYEREVYNPAGPDISDPIQLRYDELVAEEGHALDRLLKLTAPSPTELAIKLKIIAEGEEWRLAEDRTIAAKLAADGRRFGRHGAYLQSDAKLLDAFAASKKERCSWLPHAGEPLNSDEYELSVGRSAAAEQVVWGERASTLEGVLAKLVCLFPEIVQEIWSDHAVTNPSHRTFQPGLDAADGNHRVLWATINDLARIAGVNLAELGA